MSKWMRGLSSRVYVKWEQFRRVETGNRGKEVGGMIKVKCSPKTTRGPLHQLVRRVRSIVGTLLYVCHTVYSTMSPRSVASPVLHALLLTPFHDPDGSTFHYTDQVCTEGPDLSDNMPS
jgi:hypothetical protein